MKPAIEILEQRLSQALQAACGLAAPAIVRPTADPQFGDYQVNGIMAAARQLKLNPRQLAEKTLAAADVSDLCEPPQIAGPGFINLRLTTDYVCRALLEVHKDSRLGVEKTNTPQTVVVDYSGVNIAKEMHVGHLRSTIIGDCIVRILECLGHTVIRQNHIGDWGTQFGMLCALYDKKLLETSKSGNALDRSETLKDLELFYQQAKKLYDEDADFAKTARAAIAGLHKGEGIWKIYWQNIVNETRKHYLPIYERLNVTLRPEHERGESFYRDMLAGVVADLRKKELAVESEGAVCVFPEGFKGKEGEPLPFIIQKSDGAFLYATTDLAAVCFRLKDLGANRIIYLTDTRQALHFKMLFAVVKLAGWANESIKLEHITFGTMLGTDGKPFKTRTGGTVKLAELLDEAVERALKVVEEKNPHLPDEQKKAIAQTVGVGAVKYADYSNNRDSDYIFSFDKMLAMEGNTAPYMQYAYARIQSIERKAAGRDVDVESELAAITSLTLTEPAELELAKQLIRYSTAIQSAAADCRPNYLTGYLYDLSQSFSRFYNACPVLGAEGQTRSARLLLCSLTARTIRHGMNQLLGIDTPEQM